MSEQRNTREGVLPAHRVSGHGTLAAMDAVALKTDGAVASSDSTDAAMERW
jgi:hypothetical protein